MPITALRRRDTESPRSNTHRRRGTALAGILTLAAGLAVALTTTAAPAEAVDNGLGRTPIMGFNDWNAFGCDVSAQLIEQTADLFVSDGLKDAGYEYLNIDDCWMTSSRNVGGHLVPDPAKFPNGISAVADYVHSLGLKLGIYESAGLTTCQGYPGSLGHEQTDADDFAAWGVDLLKYDNCGTTPDVATTKAQYVARYRTMARALQHSGRDIVYSICEWGNFEPWTWAGRFGNYWRTTGDITDSYASMVSIVAQNAKLAQYASPGAFNDPDMLEIGNGGMTDTEYRSEFSLWSIMAAPLIAGTDLRDASAATLKIYTNSDVIAVDQDSLGKQGTLLTSANGHYVFAKPLANGDVAVALFNSTDTGARLATSAHAAGARARTGLYTVKDLWTKQTTESQGGLSAYVPAHATVMYRVHPVNDLTTAVQVMRSVPAHTSLSVEPATSTLPYGATTTARVSLRNDSAVAVRNIALSLTASGGWRVGRGSGAAPTLDPGTSTTARYALTAPDGGALVARAGTTARATYYDIGTSRYAASQTSLTAYAPTSAATANTTGADAVLAQQGSRYEIVAAGAGVQAASQSPFGSVAAADEYAAVYRPDAVDADATAAVTVAAQTGDSGFTSHGASGLMVRNDATAQGDSAEGVVLYLTSSGHVGLAWAASGGTTVDTTIGGRGGPGSTTVATPVRLRLVRDGTRYTGAYSTDGGATWTTVGTATLPSADAGQDVAIYHTSGSATDSSATFAGWSVR